MAATRITVAQVLLPLFLISLVIVLFLGFQTTLLVSDRTALQQTRVQQDKPLEQLGKVKAQVNALALGTMQLAKQGNKDAQNIIVELKKAGVDVSDQAPAASTPAATSPGAPAQPQSPASPTP